MRLCLGCELRGGHEQLMNCLLWQVCCAATRCSWKAGRRFECDHGNRRAGLNTPQAAGWTPMGWWNWRLSLEERLRASGYRESATWMELGVCVGLRSAHGFRTVCDLITTAVRSLW